MVRFHARLPQAGLHAHGCVRGQRGLVVADGGLYARLEGCFGLYFDFQGEEGNCKCLWVGEVSRSY